MNSLQQRKVDLAALGIAFVILGLLFTDQVFAILQINNGKFIFTLDDPYIHLAMAENLQHGHYGVNLQETSAPSSSILWPFLLVPVAGLSWSPLVLNIIFSFATLYFFWKILVSCLVIEDNRARFGMILLLLFFSIFVADLVWLTFTGMEHVLHILTVVIVVYGLLVYIQTSRVPVWLMIAIVALPVLRFESIVISAAALLLLLLGRRFQPVIWASLAICVIVGGFAIWLLSQGLGPLPSSVIAKAAMLESRGVTGVEVTILQFFQYHPSGRYLLQILIVLFLISYGLISNASLVFRQFALISSLPLLAILYTGEFGSINQSRHVIFVWVYSVTVGYILLAAPMARFMNSTERKYAALRVMVPCAVVLFLIATPFMGRLPYLATASNNIYEQQYQMHRFLTEFLEEPAAVNDLGWTSYKNDDYVLDLWGLASLEALRLRLGASHDPQHSNPKAAADEDKQSWMEDMAEKKSTPIALIYVEWFDGLPESWIPLGYLELSRANIACAHSRVVFAAIDQNKIPSLLQKIRSWEKTLPETVKFSYFTDSPENISDNRRIEEFE